MLGDPAGRASGVKTPELARLFGTAEAMPSRERFMRGLLVLCPEAKVKMYGVFGD